MTIEPSAGPAPAARSVAADTALVATFAALLAVCSLLSISLGATAVPVTLQTFAVLLSGAVLGARRGLLAVLLYLAVGLAGLPVFAQGGAGLAVLGRPSVGYLLSFPLAAAAVGWLVQRSSGQRWVPRTGSILLATVAGTLVTYAVGVPVMAAVARISLAEAFVVNLAFVPLDLAKAALAAVTAAAVHRAFPDLLRQG